MGTLDGKVAMVTGSGGEHGFGRAMARRFAEAGADVVVTDVAPTGVKAVAKPSTGWGGLEAVAAEVQKMGRRALPVLMDVRSATEVEQAVTRALTELGRLDILVNNAAAPPGADRVPVVDVSEEAWDTVLDTNLKGTFLCARAVARTMLSQRTRGRIINISSNCGKLGYARYAAYCASKFGVIGFTQALALELAEAGITVNAICPGPADTDRLDYMGRRPDGGFDPVLRARGIAERAAAVPVRRLAVPEDVAEVAAFLASDAAEYITGQAINVAGGAIMH
jgi:3-oxoacyl-[acyl-carrier protein] reductase/meso-butanediol dehydrogenase/(S,S)-butanediol dehydrogenase/diacetyl reductase